MLKKLLINSRYSFGQLGNLTARSDLNQGLSESFTYDDQNRITSYAIIGGATKTVAYDALGNITSKSDVGTYSYNASGSGSVRPHAVAAITPSDPGAGTGTTNTTYTYDANGNMLTGNGRTATWTSFNMVASITRATNTVSFDGACPRAALTRTRGTASTAASVRSQTATRRSTSTTRPRA